MLAARGVHDVIANDVRRARLCRLFLILFVIAAVWAVAVALTGVASLFALLILAAHGVTLLLTRARGHRGRTAPGHR